ncbi:hypothetical protein QJS66_20240 [Kocuria rhizophila]|nr:hypothetical protein QJS66_20240 [Kocuria rhizophila]
MEAGERGRAAHTWVDWTPEMVARRIVPTTCGASTPLGRSPRGRTGFGGGATGDPPDGQPFTVTMRTPATTSSS